MKHKFETNSLHLIFYSFLSFLSSGYRSNFRSDIRLILTCLQPLICFTSVHATVDLKNALLTNIGFQGWRKNDTQIQIFQRLQPKNICIRKLLSVTVNFSNEVWPRGVVAKATAYFCFKPFFMNREPTSFLPLKVLIHKTNYKNSF